MCPHINPSCHECYVNFSIWKNSTFSHRFSYQIRLLPLSSGVRSFSTLDILWIFIWILLPQGANSCDLVTQPIFIDHKTFLCILIFLKKKKKLQPNRFEFFSYISFYPEMLTYPFNVQVEPLRIYTYLKFLREDSPS